MLRAPAFMSQRWKSATGSLLRLDRLLLPGLLSSAWPLVRDWPLLLLRGGTSSRDSDT
jgi:hypothetical protein